MTPDQVALLSAAIRHVRDAEALLAASPDQAWHLAGFGPECARKACLSERWADKALGHQLGLVAEPALATAIALDARAARYRLDAWSSNWPSFTAWTPEGRYHRTGAHAPAAPALVGEARAAVDRVVCDLWADGALPTLEELG